MIRTVGYFIPALLWALLIWSLSTTSNLPPIPWEFLSPDKIGHLVFYAIETLLLIGAMAKSQDWQKNNYLWILICMIIAGAYGMSLEFVQATLPDRSFDYADMIANFVGTLVGALFYVKFAWRYFLLPSSET